MLFQRAIDPPHHFDRLDNRFTRPRVVNPRPETDAQPLVTSPRRTRQGFQPTPRNDSWQRGAAPGCVSSPPGDDCMHGRSRRRRRCTLCPGEQAPHVISIAVSLLWLWSRLAELGFRAAQGCVAASAHGGMRARRHPIRALLFPGDSGRFLDPRRFGSPGGGAFPRGSTGHDGNGLDGPVWNWSATLALRTHRRNRSVAIVFLSSSADRGRQPATRDLIA